MLDTAGASTLSLCQKMNPYRWSRDELEHRDIPNAAKEFLATEGLPQFTDYPSLEFGSYDCESAFVIGQCGADPIIIREPTGTVIIVAKAGNELYMNSQVEDIPFFIDLILNGGYLNDVASSMLSRDPKSLESFEGCFWAQVFYDCKVQGFLE